MTALQFMFDTLRDPAGTARYIKGLRLPHLEAWGGFLAATILMVVLVHAERYLPGAIQADVANRPLLDIAIIGGLTALLVFVLYFGGRAMGGKGTFGATLAIMAWFQFVVVFLLSIQILLALIAPWVSEVLLVANITLQLWCIVNFMNAVHEFNSLGKAAGLIVLSIIGLGMGLSLIIVLIGGVAVAQG